MEGDIAAMAWIEQQVLALSEREGALRRSVRRIEKAYDVAPRSFGTGLFWQTRALSLLYLLVVFPREHWRMEPDDPTFSDIAQQWSLDGVNILTADLDEEYRNTSYGFIRRLRNAVAHAHIAFRGDDMEFWDVWHGKEAYRARLTRSEVERFVGTVGAVMANRRNRADP